MEGVKNPVGEGEGGLGEGEGGLGEGEVLYINFCISIRVWGFLYQFLTNLCLALSSSILLGCKKSFCFLY